MGAKLPSVETVFGEAMEIAAPAERSAYLDRACGGDAVLRRQVESLLDAHTRAGDFLESPASTPTITRATKPAVEGPGTTIGPYRLLEEIGEGGMGVVYMAEQTAPVRRRVALKVIRPGMDSRQVVARFEAERQALAMMDHPNIATVHDAGAAESGRPYFVMELVRGLAITDYCDHEGLSVAERLELFVLVCRAVQHAHQKGVIHRDLKPSNVLVTVIDGVPTPKVIDFGVAKATGGSLTDRSLFTGFHQIIGTPLYMSPEQADLSSADIDTRSDIYALGVLLYELLTGTTPFDRETFQQAAFDEMRRMIREDEPPKPSTRLSNLGGTLSTVSARRGSDPRRLDRAVRGELDWITMKALEKDRRGRYETASDFAADVMRYLTDRPVEACPPTARYRMGKYTRRHRAALTTGGLVALALVTGTVVSTWQAFRATRAEGRTASALGEARANLGEANRQRALARKAVDEMYTEAAEKWLATDGRLTALQREFLEKALAFYQEFAAQKGDDAAVQAELARAELRVGDIRSTLGRHAQAVASYEQARGVLTRLAATAPDPTEHRRGLARAEREIGRQYERIGRSREAEESIRRSIAISEDLAARSPGETEAVVDLTVGLGELAMILASTVRLDEGEKAGRRCVDLLTKVCDKEPGSPRYRALLARAHRRVGATLARRDRREESKKETRKALALYRTLVAESPGEPAHRQGLLYCLFGLSLEDKLVDLTEAREALSIAGTLAGQYPTRPIYREDLIRCQTLLAHQLRTGDLSEPERLGREAVSVSERLAAEYPDVVDYRQSLADALSQLGRTLALAGREREAATYYERSLALARKLVDEHPDSRDHKHVLARMAHVTAELLAIARDPEVRDAARAVTLARMSVEILPGEMDAVFWKVLGTAEYKAGNWDAALRAVEKDAELRGGGGYAYPWLIRALAHARRGEMKEARAWFAKLPPKFKPGEMADTPRDLYDEAVALFGETTEAGAVPK